MNPARRSPVEAEAKRRRLKDLSQVYFSAPAADTVRDEPAPVPEQALPPAAPASSSRSPRALLPAANLAGAPGLEFLRSLRRSLEGRGYSSLEVASEDAGFTVSGEAKGRLSAAALLDRIRAGGDPSFLLFVSEAVPGEDISLLKNGDTTLLLFRTEVPDLRRTYLLLKDLSRAEGGTLPVLVPIGRPDTPWGRIAPIRLAEAAARFLGWRLSVWAGEPGEVSGLLARRLERMRERREGGIEPLVHRLGLVLGGAP
jgi:hypothetical protein